MSNALFVVAALAAFGCHDEPTYVVTFDTHDLAPVRDLAAGPTVPTVARHVDECAGDDDCVLVRADCCGCVNGGRATAIARGKVAEHEAALAASCGKAPACARAANPDVTCAMVAVCVEKRCMLSDKKPAAPAGAASAVDDTCKHAGDCVAVTDGCCDCANGGRDRAVAKKAAKAYRAAQAKRCGTTACVTVISTDPTCFAAPDCVGGHCQLARANKK